MADRRAQRDADPPGAGAEGGLSPEVRALWARTRLLVWPEPCRLVSLPLDALDAAAEWIGGAAGSFAALIVERDEVSLTLPEGLWLGSPLRGLARASAGPFRALTLDLDIDLAVTGYLAPLTERLAAAGVSIVPQCAYAKDHLLVREEQLETAVAVVEALVAEAAAAAGADR